ncbi:phenoloxidase-activating factor 2 isoform X2 [Acyrthosiphon pisum]|uniref:Phenoloxidase-activating factor 2 n=1 Tax=Acyrthosiphon pisum TaxID=7029 RepID=A0A8R2A7R5_ACYPI|nr:phenoloxidase-activating factor 2 isoform X2 [Acyrthosiphon pisum]|eukprot:XP_003244500.1 PREDICTED: serine protease 46-like isoform X2 [Acyrthosiphon pisum]
MSSLHTTIALVAAVAVAVTVHSTVAAPQSDGDATITIAGQQCKCVPFYLCESSNTVDVPSGSTELGCGDSVCCRVQSDLPLPPVTESYIPSSELPLISSSTQEPYIENNKPCTCVSRNQCLSPNGSNQRQSSNIRAGSCSSNKVCCINEYVNIGTTQETPIIGEPTNNNDHSCGIDNSNTHFGQFPWMAAILKTDINEETGIKTENVFLCGGSLIHPRVILTAAHCVRGKDVKLMKVRVGVWDTQSNSNEEDREKSHEDRGVSKIVYHPNHNNGTMFNDVALVELESEIILHPHVNVICIPNNEKQINYDPQSCVSTGWGKNGFEQGSKYQTVLKKVDLSLVPNDLCQQQLRTTRLGNFFRLHESFLCAGGIKGVDVCKGDGGGPLICAMKGYQGKSKKYIQVGIVSWGIGCGDENIPGVYSSVAANSQWINKELKTIISQ